MIFDLKRRERPAGARVGIHGLAPNLAALIPDYDPNAFARAVRTVPRVGIITQIGRGASQQAAYLKRFLAFLCDCGAAPGASPSRRRPLARGAERGHRGHRGKVRVAASFARKALVVRIDEVRYAADFSNAFIVPPGDMLGAAIAQWLDMAGLFRSVSQPGTQTPGSQVLEATVTELYGDFRSGPGQPP